uniref:Uncharacterized protein n=1 Tax=Bigelowiella natans TaxID=227086 RepID=A0A7S2KGW6_BIGNA
MERLVTEALKALASLFDIKTLNLYAALHKKTVKGSFHMVGRVLTKPFDVSFAASIDFTNIKTMALSAVKSVLTSIFGNVGKKEIKDLSEIEGLLRLGSGDFGDSSSNISHSLQYFLPKPLHHSEPLIQRPTGMIFTPSATGSAFEMEELCRAVLSALKNIDHTAVYVDLSNLPGTCSLPATVGANNTLQQVPCINKVIEQCLSPGSIHMHKRKAFYHSAESTRLEVATHHKQYMSKLMQTCESSKCHDLAHDLATDTWSVSFKANDAAGSGLIPKLPDVSADIPVRYSFDLSDNSYHGDIPDLNGPGLHSLNLAGNWITGGLQNIAAAKNLQSLDLSNNYGLSHDGECIADTLKELTALSHFNFQGNDRLVPSEPIRCTRQRVIDTAGIHLVEELAHDSLVVGGICGGCDTNLAPFGCLGFPCMNASLLELQIDSILEKAQEVVAAEDLNIEQLSRDMIEILNFDQPSNGTGFYVTYTIKPSQANAEERPFSLAQARSFSQLMGKKPEIVANTTACQPGLAGPNCDIECYYGWERTSAIPPTDDSEHEIKSHRLPRCHTPVTFDTCPNSTLVAALRDVTEHCDGTQTPKSKELCLEALYPAVGLLKSTQATADIPQNLTLANYFCNETALNMITEPCARAVIPVYSYATLCSPPPGNDDNNNKKAVLKVWHIVLIACAGAMILLSGVGVGVRRWYKSKGEQNQAQSEGDHGISPEYQNLPDHDDHHHKPGTWVQEPSLDPILEEPETEIDRAHRSSLGGEIISH